MTSAFSWTNLDMVAPNKCQLKRKLPLDGTVTCPFHPHEEDSLQHILCKCGNRQTTEIRDQTLKVAKPKAYLPCDNTPDAHLNTYIDFLIDNINTNPRGHRIWLGNFDASTFKYYIHMQTPLSQSSSTPQRFTKFKHYYEKDPTKWPISGPR